MDPQGDELPTAGLAPPKGAASWPDHDGETALDRQKGGLATAALDPQEGELATPGFHVYPCEVDRSTAALYPQEDESATTQFYMTHSLQERLIATWVYNTSTDGSVYKLL